ncbi:MAG: UDP-N-acetyl-D-mannosamine dehydrogenase [Thiotrichales bacterium]|nr:MAG: UDP-N-acetyl-D-mannosamine dehydrogenase [Thiotrichales bacterium]
MKHDFKSVCVMGLGYIGLPTASLLGTKGYNVHGVDISQKTVDTINEGNIHIVEPDLDILVKSAVGAGKLKAALQPAEADVFIIAVPTPFIGDHEPDLSYIKQATEAISPYIKPGNLILLESTSPVGTTDEVVATILIEKGHKVGEEVFLAYCPERVLPGQILMELVQNDRIVGGINDASTKMAVSFYQTFVNGNVFPTNSKTAEMVKLTENSFRDVNIAFANEISIIADADEISAWEVIELANKHPRVDILQPGPGVGGHCIAVDPWFMVSRTPELAKLIRTAREVNDSKPAWVINKVRTYASKFKSPIIACLGLAFKANVDDLRESPSLDIVRQIKNENLGELMICEPNIQTHNEFDLSTLDETIKKADIVLLLVNHREFTHLTALSLKDKLLIDTRGVIS